MLLDKNSPLVVLFRFLLLRKPPVWKFTPFPSCCTNFWWAHTIHYCFVKISIIATITTSKLSFLKMADQQQSSSKWFLIFWKKKNVYKMEMHQPFRFCHLWNKMWFMLFSIWWSIGELWKFVAKKYTYYLFEKYIISLVAISKCIHKRQLLRLTSNQWQNF